MIIKLMGYVGLISEEEGVFTGEIRNKDNRVVWIDGCDREDLIQTWVLGAFQELVKTGVMPELNYGD
jgi:hypothetical protein